jgi:hypothetical protein
VTGKALVTIVDGPQHDEFWEITRPTFEDYANRHGYTLVVADLSDNVPSPTWSKVVRLRELVDDYEYVLWVDCDCAISPAAPDVSVHLEDAHAFQALTFLNYRPAGLAEDPMVALGLCRPLLATGVWAIRQHPWTVEFFDALWRREDLFDDPNAEAAPVWRLLGGEGELRYMLGTVLLNELWNSRLVEDHLAVTPERSHIFHATWFGAKQQHDLRLRLLEAFVQTGTIPAELRAERDGV